MTHTTCIIALVGALACGAAARAERLVLVSASYGRNILAITDAGGEILWSYETPGPAVGHAGHHDVHLLPNGNILYHDSWTRTREITLDKTIVWTYDSKTMNGNDGRPVDVHAFARLPNGHTMIAESGVGRIIEVDADGGLVHAIPLKPGGTQSTRLVRRTPQGTYLVCSEQPGVVTEYDRSGAVVWEYPINTRVYGAIRLSNGNTLIASGSGNSVVEVTPDKRVTWEIRDTVPGTTIELGWTTMLEELPNGNFVVGNCHAGEANPQIFEIDREKNVVWQFDEYELVGNGLACWQLLDDEQSAMVRAKLASLSATVAPPPREERVYKTIGDVTLPLFIHQPAGPPPAGGRGAVVFFHGGGWNGGTPSQFFDQCEHLARRGIVAISAAYRLGSTHGATPDQCVADGKSALRWVRAHADELGIDPARIAAGGGSAGGHVAAAVATTDGFDDEPGSAISCRPDALVLFNAVFDNGPGGWGHARVKDYWEAFSPLHNISADTPPSLVMLGTHDALIPVNTAHRWKARVEAVGGRCVLELYERQPHGFFNRARNARMYEATVAAMDAFLDSLGWRTPPSDAGPAG